MITYPAEFNARKEALFAALAQMDGGGHRLRLPMVSYHDFPETEGRVAAALSRAKKQPTGRVAKALKHWLVCGQYNGARRYFARHPDRLAVAWNGLGGSRGAFLQGARDAGAGVLYAELAPFPGRVTLDPNGVNAQSSVPQDPAFYAAWAGQDAQRNGDGWRAVGQGMTARPSRRSDVGQGSDALPDTPFLFCPLQVPDDSQVTLFSGWCGDMAGFVAALGHAANHLPDGWHLRLKEHPSARHSLQPLIEPLLRAGRVVLDNASDSFAQIAASRGVVTLNSSMGLQAFFHDKPVVSLGRAFWALPGLVTPAAGQAELEDLFAAPQELRFDARFRAQVMNWLDQVYYPVFEWSKGQPPRFDKAAFAAKLAQARGLPG